ncbi:MAG TPA: cytochrome P450 [Sporichthya sp.]|nr:cytochrome P450 [Sporichthya sp.]
MKSTDVDPFSDQVLTDPHAFHEDLREAGPVVLLRHYDVFALARYEHVHAALNDWETFQSGAGVGLSDFRREKPWRPPSLLLESDPPAHDAPRAVLSRLLRSRALGDLPRQWEVAADDLVDGVLNRSDEGVVDAIPALAEAFPLRVFPDAVGIGDAGRENLLPYGDLLFNAFGPRNHLFEKRLPQMGELSGWVNAQCTREALRPDAIGAAIWAAADAGEISAEQAPLVVRSLLSAGVDTTVNALGGLLYALSTHPEEWALLRSRPELVGSAFEEAVRWESPVQTFFRTTTRDVDVSADDGATTIPEGRKILMFLGAANRDPRRWPDPDRFDVTRNAAAHVGFGMGIHHCVGQHVARAETVALVRALLRRVERIEPAGAPLRRLNNTMRAFASLPLRFQT